MGGNAGLSNEPDPLSLDKELNTLASDTLFSSTSEPSDTLPNGPPTQEKASHEAQKLEDQKSKGMIALIMSALCVSNCSLNILCCKC